MRTPASKACHNCRRMRLKCDRAVPSCRKCRLAGQECLGYGKLFLWNQGVASREKMMGKTFPVPMPEPDAQNKEATAVPCAQNALVYTEAALTLPGPPLDPLYQSLDGPSRHYLFHSDATDANPFRRLVPLCRDYPLLRHAMNAAGALHIACLDRRTEDPSDADRAVHGRHTQSQRDPPSDALIDALSAKQKALGLLRRALKDLQTLSPRRTSPAALIRDTYILGATLMKTNTLSDPFLFPGDIFAAVTRAEATSYISLPTTLLHTLFKACELSNLVSVSTMLNNPKTDYSGILSQAQTLLKSTKSFDAHAWALSLEGSSDSSRALSRVHTAPVHQNALLTYICRSVDSIASPTALGENTDTLVTNIITHLSFVASTDPIFVATTWPTFIAGAETDNPVYRRWAVDRLAEFWSLVGTAWRLRDEAGAGDRAEGAVKRESWIQQLKELKKYWLIA
ncbi:hypothetical protein BDW75DRAFT_231214 [Aspergillus navahoensis]